MSEKKLNCSTNYRPTPTRTLSLLFRKTCYNTHPELSTLKYPHTSGVERKLSSLIVPLVGYVPSPEEDASFNTPAPIAPR